MSKTDARLQAARDREAAEYAVTMVNRLVDVLFSTAMGMNRMISGAPEEVPRLLISASGRMIERMIEAYRARQAAADAGHAPFPAEEAAQRRREIHLACLDALESLEEGRKMIQLIQQSLGDMPDPPATH